MKYKTFLIVMIAGVAMFFAGRGCSVKNKKEENFSTLIHGQFILKGSNYAGFNFINPIRVIWTNEMDSSHPDTLKLGWLNNFTFFTCEIKRMNEECPPGVSIYKVISCDGKQLILKDIWTGWNDHEDDTLILFK
jgi:hypothetical protein